MTLENGKKVNFWHDILMEKTPAIKVSQDLKLKTIETTKISYFIESNKTLNIFKLNSISLNTLWTNLLVFPLMWMIVRIKLLRIHIQ